MIWSADHDLEVWGQHILGPQAHEQEHHLMSILLTGIPAVFSSNSEKMPKSLRGSLYGMASSVCFVVPFVRQLWWWLGLR